MAGDDTANRRREQIDKNCHDCPAMKAREQITIRDIVMAANVSCGALHIHFGDNREVLLALVDSFLRQRESRHGLGQENQRKEQAIENQCVRTPEPDCSIAQQE